MIITVLTAGYIRLILRLYFLLALAATAYLAQKHLQLRAKLRLIRNRHVPIPHILGWIQGTDLLKAIWSLKDLPGGKLGYTAMVIIFALSKVTDLITTSLVQQVPIQSRCTFGEGLVFNKTGPALFEWPPVNGAPYIVVHNSQYFSQNNSCPYGIYNKVNRDTSFCPSQKDIIGSWSCTSGAAVTYPTAYDLRLILVDFQNKDLLYANVSTTRSVFGENYNHFVLWSSSAASDTVGSTWDVKAAVQTNSSPFDDVEMLPLSCTMNATDAEIALEGMMPLTTLTLWTNAFQGLMYYGTGTPIVKDPTDELAMLLNTMVMVQGGNNILLHTPAEDEDQTQGCIIRATNVPLVVEALVLVVAGLFMWLLFLVVVYAVRLWMKDRVLREAVEHLPDGVVGWAALAAKEHEISKDQEFAGRVRQRKLKEWIVGLEVGGAQRRLRVMPAEAAVDEVELTDGARRRMLA